MIINNRRFVKNILAVFLNIIQCFGTNGNDDVNLTFELRLEYCINRKNVVIIKYA